MSLPPSDDTYIGEPQYPAPWTTKKPREGLRDTDAARIVSLAPDVCKAPGCPVPFPVVDFCGHDENYTPSVRFTSEKAMVLRSNTTHVHGDEPGIGKGVKSGTVGARCHPIEHADQVRAEGSNVIRHLDRFHMNDCNTVGEACFVRDTKAYAAPKDDDKIPGSLKWPDKPIQLAFDGTDWQKFLPPQTETPPAKPQTQTKVPEPKTAPEVERKGSFGKPVVPGAGLAGAAAVANELAQSTLPGTRLWRLQRGLAAEGIVVDLNDPSELAALRNYSENLGGTSFLKRNFYPPMTEAEAREQLQRELQEARAKKKEEEEQKPKPAPLSQTQTARVDRPNCHVLVLTFSTPAKGTKKEMQRQLNLQQGVLNSKNPCVAAKDIANYSNVKAIGEAARPGARRGFIQANANALRFANPKLSPAQALAMAEKAAVGQHAIHTLDMVAGGHPTTFAGLGGGSENSSIGSQWGPGGKSNTLSNYAVDQCKNKCPKMQTQLIAI